MIRVIAAAVFVAWASGARAGDVNWAFGAGTPAKTVGLDWDFSSKPAEAPPPKPKPKTTPEPVGEPDPPAGYHAETAADGTRWWVKDGYSFGAGRPAAPGVAAPTFRDNNPSHRCSNCGHQSPSGVGTWVVVGYNRDGTHTHRCPQCGHSWSH